LRTVLEENGELLPFESDIGTYFLYNIRTIVAGLDVEHSECEAFDDGRIFNINHYEFEPEKVEDLTIFRLGIEPSQVYVTNAFVRRVRSSGLMGFEFIRVWPLPPNISYVSLHEREKLRREKSELPAGQTLKGNSLHIHLLLEGDKPNEKERLGVSRLADELDAFLVDLEPIAPAVGNLEQVEYHKGECCLCLSCPDADLLVRKLLSRLKTLEWPGGYVVAKRYGEYDNPEVEDIHVEVG